MSEQSLETIGTLESKLMELGMSFRPIKAGTSLIYEIEILRLIIIVDARTIYDPDGVPLRNRSFEEIEWYLSPKIDDRHRYDPNQDKANPDLKFSEALFWCPEFDQLMLTQRDAAYTISKEFGVGVFLGPTFSFYDRFVRFGMITHNNKEWIPAIKSVMGAYSALEAYKNV